MKRPLWLILLALYAIALAASHAVQTRSPAARTSAELPRFTAEGPPDADPIRISYDLRRAPDPTSVANDRPTVLLLHGSPGSLSNFNALAPALNAAGYDTIAVDLPGFGASEPHIPDYSVRAHARYALALLDRLGIERVHALGWSMGGGVCIELDRLTRDRAPDRLASVTLLGAIGAQSTEGSGSWFFEKAKYTAGYAALVALPNLVPHFGLYPARPAHSFIRNFLDTDQRPLAGAMRTTATPYLILHGRNDFLVSDWAAERHHDILPTSRLVMTPHSHFLPVAQPRETAAFIANFIARHDRPGVRPLTHAADHDPVPVRTGPLGLLDRVAVAARDWPWWFVVPIGALCARFRPELTTVLLAWLCARLSLDFGVAAVAIFIGRRLAPRSPWRRPDRAGAAVRTATDLIWTPVALLIAQALMTADLADAAVGLGFALLVTLVTAGLHVVRALPTRTGRIRLRTNLSKALHHEWWPASLLYAGLAPHLVRLAFRHRSALVWTAANPGVRPDEGIRGESKSELLTRIDHPAVLPFAVVDGPHDGRAARAREIIGSTPDLGGFPIIVKPDAGERGRDVSLVRTPDDLDAALAPITGAVMLQKFHPGPVEAGVFWIRDLDTVDRAPDSAGAHGFVFAITRKTLPELTGDGSRTLRRLVERHPRYRKQMAVHARRPDFDTLVPAARENVRLTEAGNHSRGCMFSDGEDLRTPELEAAIDAVARAYRGPNAEPYDFGRFDIRAHGEDELKAGRFAVIELNGTTSEATNLYDPNRSSRWAYRVLRRQWSLLFALGAARARQGSPAITWRRLLAVALGAVRA